MTKLDFLINFFEIKIVIVQYSDNLDTDLESELFCVF